MSQFPTPFEDPQQQEDPAEQEIVEQDQVETTKANNLLEAVGIAAKGRVPTGMHNIHIHVNLPSEYITEVYNERLAQVPPQKTKQQAKRLDARIDNFLVRCLVYPKGKIVITIPCSARPFPISHIRDANNITSDFNAFVAQIRYFLCSRISDFRGIIVPPIHSRSWRLIQADINWDIPTTAMNFSTMCNIQVTRLSGIILRVYRKSIEGHKYVRVEEATHGFANSSFDANIGSTIIDAIKHAQKELVSNGK